VFTQMVPDFLKSGGRLPARRPVSGCELGRPPRASGRSDAREDAIARHIGRLAVDNNLIAVGVSRIPPSRAAAVTAALTPQHGPVPVIGCEG
jgi:hypothetical protein